MTSFYYVLITISYQSFYPKREFFENSLLKFTISTFESTLQKKKSFGQVKSSTNAIFSFIHLVSNWISVTFLSNLILFIYKWNNITWGSMRRKLPIACALSFDMFALLSGEFVRLKPNNSPNLQIFIN